MSAEPAAAGPKRLRVELITPDGPIYVDDATMLIVPGEAGELGVLPRHISLVARLEPGETRIKTSETEWVTYATSTGYFKIQNDVASVLVQAAWKADEIDPDAAERDRADAQERLAAASDEESDIDLHRARRDLADAEARLRVIGRL